ncbi:TetR/AcrR family transcriptional regulator [Kitasatospora sp. NPDC088346]|uniref:TetR/AcrR family transcriptional regulator n=1 Tax=Kitasatospora sp. NPDC088346 TaxID=3364073 RepID=UPI0038069C29
MNQTDRRPEPVTPEAPAAHREGSRVSTGGKGEPSGADAVELAVAALRAASTADEGAPAGRAPGGAGQGVAAPVAVRRRGRALEVAIFDAALDQLTSGGFARMTMEGVAGAAHTGKAALYRRWASKADLVVDALGSTLPPPTDIPDLGSVRDELVQLTAYLGVVMNSRAGTAVRVLMAELDHEQVVPFKGFVLNRVIEPVTEAMLAILRRGEARGDVRRGAATSLVADVAPAMLLYRAKVWDGPLDAEFCRELAEQVLLPMVRP